MKSGRGQQKVIAFQALYSWDVNAVSLEELLEFSWVDSAVLDRMGSDNLLFTKLLISGTIENIEEIDSVIKKHLTAKWSFERISKVDLAVLRLSVYPLLYQKDMPASIIIDEAIDISKEFGSDDSFKFINGVLDSVKNAYRSES